MGKKRKLISHPQFWNKFADHPAVKARQTAEEPVKVEPGPEPKVEAKKVEVKKVEPKPEPKPVIAKPTLKSTVEKKVVFTKKKDKKSV